MTLPHYSPDFLLKVPQKDRENPYVWDVLLPPWGWAKSLETPKEFALRPGRKWFPLKIILGLPSGKLT